jgi:hypothetical protein
MSNYKKISTPYIINLLELFTTQQYIMINGEIITPIKIWDKKNRLPKNNDLFFTGKNKNGEIKYYNIHDIICEISHPSAYILRGGEKIFIIDENGIKKDIK